MKSSVSQSVETFRPITLTLTLETKEEARALQDLVLNYETVAEAATLSVAMEEQLRQLLRGINDRIKASGLFNSLF